MLTHTGEINIEEINNVITNITQITQQTNREAGILVETMIEESTLPCQSGVTVCNRCSKTNEYLSTLTISLLIFICSN